MLCEVSAAPQILAPLCWAALQQLWGQGSHRAGTSRWAWYSNSSYLKRTQPRHMEEHHSKRDVPALVPAEPSARAAGEDSTAVIHLSKSQQKKRLKQQRYGAIHAIKALQSRTLPSALDMCPFAGGRPRRLRKRPRPRSRSIERLKRVTSNCKKSLGKCLTVKGWLGPLSVRLYAR